MTKEDDEEEIEVEMRFQPTEEQERKLTEGATFLGEEINHDIYYDFSDFRLFDSKVKLRYRNGKFELKIKESRGSSGEIKNQEEIKKYLKTDLSVKEFVDKRMEVLMEYKTRRQKYKKDQFTIAFDECDFGYEGCEIEILTKDKSQKNKLESDITNFALSCGLEIKKVPTKSEEYLRIKKPEIYKELFVKRELRKVFKIK